MIHDIVQPLRPIGPGWSGGQDVRTRLQSAYPITHWWYAPARLYVLSAVEVATEPDGVTRGPEYHISVSKQTLDLRPSRCSAEEGACVLTAFGLDGWEEDNHVPDGKVRNYWRAVAENMVGRACACKETEHLRVGYMLWADTTTGLLKIRNAANTAWITVGTLASTNLGLLALGGRG